MLVLMSDIQPNDLLALLFVQSSQNSHLINAKVTVSRSPSKFPRESKSQTAQSQANHKNVN